jgi:hypothetical protein
MVPVVVRVFVNYVEELCVPKTLSVLMTLRNHPSWRNDPAVLFRFGRSRLTIQVEVAA